MKLLATCCMLLVLGGTESPSKEEDALVNALASVGVEADDNLVTRSSFSSTRKQEWTPISSWRKGMLCWPIPVELSS
jgi:hypothetical protein